MGASFAGRVHALELGDFDADGDLDAFCISPNGPSQLLYNDAAGVFTVHQSLASSLSQFVVVGDLDRDGDLDVLFEGVNGAIEQWRMSGGVLVDANADLVGGGNTYRGLLRDFDGGDLDFLEGLDNNSSGDRVWLNDGAGSFATFVTVAPAGTTTLGMAAGDVDGDGDEDIVFSWSNDRNRVYRGSLSGTWGTVTYADSACCRAGRPRRRWRPRPGGRQRRPQAAPRLPQRRRRLRRLGSGPGGPRDAGCCARRRRSGRRPRPRRRRLER